MGATATADPLRAKALKCIRERRVAVLRVAPDAHWRPTLVIARVRSSRDLHPYRVQLIAGRWTCTCREGLRDEPCAHVAAVVLVTTGAAA